MSSNERFLVNKGEGEGGTLMFSVFKNVQYTEPALSNHCHPLLYGGPYSVALQIDAIGYISFKMNRFLRWVEPIKT
jgi:hypothetical protein